MTGSTAAPVPTRKYLKSLGAVCPDRRSLTRRVQLPTPIHHRWLPPPRGRTYRSDWVHERAVDGGTGRGGWLVGPRVPARRRGCAGALEMEHGPADRSARRLAGGDGPAGGSRRPARAGQRIVVERVLGGLSPRGPARSRCSCSTRANGCWPPSPVRTDGQLVRRRVGLENEHAPYWAAAVDPRALEREPALAGALLDRLTGGVDCLELRRLPLDGPLARALKAEASARRWPVVELTNPVGEVGLPLFGPVAELPQDAVQEPATGRAPADQVAGRAELRGGGGRRSQLEAGAGRLCFDLEARGWKGQLGTPVLADAAAHRFYRQLAAAGERPRAAGAVPVEAGRPPDRLRIHLRGGGRIECLKIGYDESLSRFSPGTGLRMLILRRAIERGEAREYRLGRESEWKRRWVTDLTRIGTLRVYAGSRRGRLAYYGGPALRSLVKRLPGVQRLVAGCAGGWRRPPSTCGGGGATNEDGHDRQRRAPGDRRARGRRAPPGRPGRRWPSRPRSPTPSCRPGMLLPAARAFGRGRTLRLLFFYAPHPTHKAQPDVLVGLLRAGGAPVGRGAAGAGDHQLRPSRPAPGDAAGAGRLHRGRWWSGCWPTWTTAAGWSPCASCAATARFTGRWSTGLNARRWLHVGLRRTTRALLRPADSAEAYLAQALAGKRRKELRRQHDRLHEQGGLSVATLAADEDPGPWLEDFLRLEAAGWKGREGEPMDGSAGTRQFFHEAMREGHRQGRLHLMALRLGGTADRHEGEPAGRRRRLRLQDRLRRGVGPLLAGRAAGAGEHPLVPRAAAARLDGLLRPPRPLHDQPPVDRTAGPIEMLAFSNGHASTSLMVSLLPAVGWARRAATGAEA